MSGSIERTNARQRVLYVLSASVFVSLALAGCGSTRTSPISTNQRNQNEILAGIGTKANVTCEGKICDIVTKEPFHNLKEAWFLALPVISAIDSDPELEGIRKVNLEIVDKHRAIEATFRCSLRHEVKTTGSTPSRTGVADIKKICNAGVKPL
jgi:hypothetical protein